MPERRRASRRVAGILAGAVGITAIVLGATWVAFFGARRLGSGPFRSITAAITENSTLVALNKAIRASDPRALAVLQQRVLSPSDAPRQALGDQAAAEWVETLSCLRTGYPKFLPAARAAAITVSCRIFDKFAVEPAPARWVEALRPVHDLLTASLAQPDTGPQATALEEISRLWIWIPGRSLMPFEEQTLGEWKGALCPPVVRCLASPHDAIRMAAVRCLGALPIDSAAAAAIAYVEDRSADVRKQTLSSFARRNLLLTDETLLKRLHDDDPTIREMANVILRTRGLTQELIGLGGLIFSPKPQQRVSVIPLLKNRTDVDPVIWLIQLSRDPVETVRLSAIEALANHQTPSVQRRLAEMARSDGSEAVRQAARKVIPSAKETTASLPPLPGSSSFNPKAN
jgi:hypothetical protein